MAANNLSAAGWTYIIYSDLETGVKNKIQAQSPDHNALLDEEHDDDHRPLPAGGV